MSKYNIANPANSIDWIANSLIMIDIWTVQDHILFDTKQYLNVTEITPQTFKVLSHIQYCYSIYSAMGSRPEFQLTGLFLG